ncbi:hypothetical protein ACHAWF_000789, partial [Thalassiosira exigua]
RSDRSSEGRRRTSRPSCQRGLRRRRRRRRRLERRRGRRRREAIRRSVEIRSRALQEPHPQRERPAPAARGRGARDAERAQGTVPVRRPVRDDPTAAVRVGLDAHARNLLGPLRSQRRRRRRGAQRRPLDGSAALPLVRRRPVRREGVSGEGTGDLRGRGRSRGRPGLHRRQRGSLPLRDRSRLSTILALPPERRDGLRSPAVLVRGFLLLPLRRRRALDASPAVRRPERRVLCQLDRRRRGSEPWVPRRHERDRVRHGGRRRLGRQRHSKGRRVVDGLQRLWARPLVLVRALVSLS